MIKLVDYWAEWCVDPQTPILTEQGYLPAEKIKKEMSLVTIDPKAYSQAIKKVTKIRVFNNVPSKKLILETGRSLIGDHNHLVLTQEGFKSLGELNDHDLILVNPSEDSLVFESENDQIILTSTGNNYADGVLTQLNLLSLRANDSKLLILARLLGFVMTDGYLYEDLKHNIYETHFYVGTKEDADEIKKDLQKLGFDKLEIKYQIKDRVIGERKFTIKVLRCRNFNRALFFLLKSLGSPVGRKKNQAYFVPNWIISAEEQIKRQFLSGWLGGDGCKIDYYIKHEDLSSHYGGFKVNPIEFHKEKDLEREGILYAKQLGILFEELGVKVNEIASIDDEDGVIISIRLATNYFSLLNLAKIGYSYSLTKNKQTPLIKEFLQYRLFERNYYSQVKQAVLQQLALGISNKSIASDLAIPLRTVVSWRYDQTSQITHPSNYGQAKFRDWMNERIQNDLLWERVKIIEEVENRDVIGITVEEPHTIITNGIVSHNCGPCKLMEPILEEIEKELAGKVEIEKVNVDEDPKRASDNGVMGIPTYVVMKDGKEIARKVGFTPKDTLLKIIKQ